MNTFYYEGKEISITKQFSNWNLVTYAKEEDIKRLCMSVRHYAYIYHDREEVEPHFHVLLSGTSISANAIKKRLNSTQNTRFALMKNRFDSFNYLTHKGYNDKILYEDSLVSCDCLDFWQLQTAERQEENNEQFLNDLLCLTKYNLAVKYGRDFMRNYKTYLEFAILVKDEEEFLNKAKKLKENEKYLENM